MTDTSTLCLDGVTVRYGQHLACDSVSFSVNSGDLFTLIGPNGAGKSSIIKAVTSQLSSYEGTISICGAPASSKQAKEKIGLAPQKPALFENLTAVENVLAFMALWNVRKDHIQARHVISNFGLDPDDQRMVSQYSGGMKQRLNIAIALAHKPRLLILDEPNASLDPDGIAIINSALESFRSNDLAILLITHDMSQAQTLATTIGVMQDGTLVEKGTPQTLTERFGPDGLDAIIRLRDEHDSAALREHGFWKNGKTWRGSAKNHQVLTDIIAKAEMGGAVIAAVEAEVPNLANAVDAILKQTSEGARPC